MRIHTIHDHLFLAKFCLWHCSPAHQNWEALGGGLGPLLLNGTGVRSRLCLFLSSQGSWQARTQDPNPPQLNHAWQSGHHWQRTFCWWHLLYMIQQHRTRSPLPLASSTVRLAFSWSENPQAENEWGPSPMNQTLAEAPQANTTQTISRSHSSGPEPGPHSLLMLQV